MDERGLGGGSRRLKSCQQFSNFARFAFSSTLITDYYEYCLGKRLFSRVDYKRGLCFAKIPEKPEKEKFVKQYSADLIPDLYTRDQGGKLQKVNPAKEYGERVQERRIFLRIKRFSHSARWGGGGI